MLETVQIILQGGAIAVFLMGFGALLSGKLRTKQEVESVKEVQRERFTRAEQQFDTFAPLIQQLVSSQAKQAELLATLLVNQQRHTDILADILQEMQRRQ